MKILTIIGTRPEAVKMAPVQRVLRERRHVDALIVSTGQHPDLLDDPLRFFGLSPDYDCALMNVGEDPMRLVERAAESLLVLLRNLRPDFVLVQGDTSSALAGAQAGFAAGVAVGHVEAGLRTHRHLPWPEEEFRCAIDRHADLMFAPTPLAVRNLVDENLSGTIHLTGNTGIDALHLVLERLEADQHLRTQCASLLPPRSPGRPLVLATLHRRESIGAGADSFCAALIELARTDGADILLPLHPNPKINRPLRAALEGEAGMHLLPPLGYPSIVYLMRQADLILTDSGGIQEEAPTLGKRVLVLREATERPEAVQQGLAELVGLDRDRIIGAARRWLADRSVPAEASPYGDGRAAERIVATLLGDAFEPFAPATMPVERPVLRIA